MKIDKNKEKKIKEWADAGLSYLVKLIIKAFLIYCLIIAGALVLMVIGIMLSRA